MQMLLYRLYGAAGSLALRSQASQPREREGHDMRKSTGCLGSLQVRRCCCTACRLAHGCRALVPPRRQGALAGHSKSLAVLHQRVWCAKTTGTPAAPA